MIAKRRIILAKNEFAIQVARAPVYATPGALEHFTTKEIEDAIERHINLDWSDMDEEDRALNLAAAMEDNGRVLSAYMVRDKEKTDLWIITEADRSGTTVLLPSEY